MKSILVKASRDTFRGAYATDYIQQKEAGGWDIRSAAIRANKAAGIKILTMGAQAGIPCPDRLICLMRPLKVLLMSRL